MISAKISAIKAVRVFCKEAFGVSDLGTAKALVDSLAGLGMAHDCPVAMTEPKTPAEPITLDAQNLFLERNFVCALLEQRYGVAADWEIVGSLLDRTAKFQEDKRRAEVLAKRKAEIKDMLRTLMPWDRDDIANFVHELNCGEIDAQIAAEEAHIDF